VKPLISFSLGKEETKKKKKRIEKKNGKKSDQDCRIWTAGVSGDVDLDPGSERAR
jgi:hypothetical protein